MVSSFPAPSMDDILMELRPFPGVGGVLFDVRAAGRDTRLFQFAQ